MSEEEQRECQPKGPVGLPSYMLHVHNIVAARRTLHEEK